MSSSQLSTPSPLQLAFNAWNESTAWLPEVVRFSVTAAFCSQLHTLWTEPCAAIQLTTLRNWPVLAEEVTAWLNDSDFNVCDFSQVSTQKIISTLHCKKQHFSLIRFSAKRHRRYQSRIEATLTRLWKLQGTYGAELWDWFPKWQSKDYSKPHCNEWRHRCDKGALQISSVNLTHLWVSMMMVLPLKISLSQGINSSRVNQTLGV